ncbi:MAG TPA: hypothetical protein VL463_08135 [Kofleriaceae bacterium]|nr:hypothetical protein [Kofleriaceae bacterium]
MIDALRDRFAAAGSLATAIRIGLAEDPPWQVVDVVVQDEFTHDVIFARATGGETIVLDCT